MVSMGYVGGMIMSLEHCWYDSHTETDVLGHKWACLSATLQAAERYQVYCIQKDKLDKDLWLIRHF